MRRVTERLAATLDAERNRWFLWWPVLFGAGIAAYFALPVEPAAVALGTPALAAALLHAALRHRGLWLLPVAALAAVTGGAAVAKLRTELMRAPVLAVSDLRTTMSGWLQLVEPRAAGGQRLTIRVTAMSAVEPDARPVLVRLTTRQADPSLKPGDFIAVRAVLSPPPGPVLPGAYDFGRAAFYQRLGAVGFSTSPAVIATAPDDAPPLTLRISAAIEAARFSITRRITDALPGETGAIAAALITGERGGVSEETNNAYRTSGLFHILSISGLHMVIMAGALFWLVRLLLAAIPALVLMLPARKIAAAIALAGALAYLLMSGAAVATVRSYVMISIMFVAVLLDRPAVALRNIAIAAAAILIVMPESLLDPGFQMSFAAVAALVAVHEMLRVRRETRDAAGVGAAPWPGPVRMLTEIVLSTLIASAAVAPFGLFHFHNTQTMALIANILAIPVCNIIVMPAALIALIAMPFGLEAIPLWGMGQGIGVMNQVAAHVAAIPGAIWRLPDIPVAAFALMVGGGLWLILWSTAWRAIGVAAIVAGMAVAPFHARPDLIVGRDGEAVAWRQKNGNLGIVAPASATFDVTRWLEHDGDDRPLATVKAESDARCDRGACVTEVAGHSLAIVMHGVAAAEECRRAAVVVAVGRLLPERCLERRTVAGTRGGALGAEPYASATPNVARDERAAPTVGVSAQLASAGLLAIDRRHLGPRSALTVRFAGARAIVASADENRAGRPWGVRTETRASVAYSRQAR